MTNKNKIAFIETNPPHLRGSFTKCNGLEPYGLELLAASVQNEFGVKVFQQEGAPDENFVREILDFSPDVAAFSCMTYNYNSSIKLAQLAKKQNLNIKIIVGGSHISSCSDALMDSLEKGIIDYGIVGEGDSSFRELAKRLSLNQNSNDIPNLVYYKDGNFRSNPRAERISALDSLPFAFRDGNILGQTKIGQIMKPAQSEQIATATVSYSRGCPFSCTYCDSKNIWGNNVVWRSASNVVDEIKQLKKEYGTNTVLFSDLTFNANPNKVKDLCNELIARNAGVSWYVLARAATPDGTRPLVDRDLLSLMYEAGCRKIGYGLESVIPEVQREFKKVVPNELIANLVQRGHELGILNKGFVILGNSKYESPETARRTLDVLKQIRFDEIRTSFLTPFPGSKLYNDAKKNGDLLTNDFSRYTTDEPVLKCEKLTPEELVEARKQITRGYYTSKEYQDLVEDKVTRFPNLKKSYVEHHQLLRKNKII